MRSSILKFILSLYMMTHYANADIDQQIEAIKNAPIKDRFKLMNAFKKNLVKMKEEERISAIKKLTLTSHKTQAKKVLDEIKERTKKDKMRRNLEYNHIDEDNIINQITDNEEGEDDD